MVLLGEPGSGKSYELAAYWQGLRARPRETTCFSSTGAHIAILERHLADASPFQAWLSGAPLTLLVDTLDEFRPGANEAGQLIQKLLLNGPLSSCGLRIACRAAQWPVALDEQLRQMWSKERSQMGKIPVWRHCAAWM